ncbi:MAG: lipoyl synthase [Actinomycetota bacterium]|nr:lipoyl synthase [Actinomycetota bacterium]
MTERALRTRWLGRVRYRDGHALQRALFDNAADDYLLLVEHPHVYTLGLRGSLDHVLVAPESVGAELVTTNRGGDVTYHGPGQLVGYPILSMPDGPSATPAYVHSVEQLVIDACADLGFARAARLDGYPGVWVDPTGSAPRKLCAIGVRRTRGRTMHGFALNVDPDMTYFDHIVPCGIHDKGVTSLAAEGVKVTMRDVVDAIAARAAARWGGAHTERQDVSARGTAPTAATDVVPFGSPKPAWMRVKADMGAGFRDIKRTMRERKLVTVCEEAGCPNIFECWKAGTATFMINGERCTRACGFCLVDTSRPAVPDPDEAEHVADAVGRMGLAHAVITGVARDDLADGGAAAFAAAIHAVRRRCPTTSVEVLIPDCKGHPEALQTIFGAKPDVLNHNLETVARLQRAVRPQASYARSLAVLGRASAAGLTTKSGLMVGMGESEQEVLGAMADLRNIGVSILTLGQYLRPTAEHVAVARWWQPDEFDRLGAAGESMGFAHVQSSPLTRSSYHAREAAVTVSG